MWDFFLQTSSLIFLLFTWGGVYYAAKRFHFPSSACLVWSGMIIAYLSRYNILPFMDDFELTNEILFYVLLPILIFESAYNMKYSELIKNRYSISSLAIVSLIFSTFIVATLLYYTASIIGFPIPFLVALLFWSLISATDTAAALSIFKEIWIPKRLTTIFEGESLFNDGTAIALFFVILWILESYWANASISEHANYYEKFIFQYENILWVLFPLLNAGLTLLSMIVFWGLFWIFIGIIFSKIIEKIEDDTYLEVTLTLALAHAAFLLAEALNHYFLPVSGIIATVASAMFLGNYGRYKISPRVEHVMEQYWGFFSFVANSLIFILVWILLVQLEVHWEPIIALMVFVIPIVLWARFISVYPLFSFINRMKKEKYVSYTWQFMLSWGAMRGVVALMMVLLIPADIELSFWPYFPMTIQDMLLALTISVVLFSIFVQWLSLPYLAKKAKLNALSDIEKIQLYFEKALLIENSLKRISFAIEGRYIDAQEGEILKNQYVTLLQQTQERINIEQTKENFSTTLTRAIWLHALWIQQKTLFQIYKRQEVDEITFKEVLEKIHIWMENLGSSHTKILNTQNIKIPYNRLKRISGYVLGFIDHKFADPIEKKYYEMRTFHMILEKALENLENLATTETFWNFEELQGIITIYQGYDNNAENKRRTFFKTHRNVLKQLSSKLTKKALHIREEEYIMDKQRSMIFGERVGKNLLKEMDLHLKEIL